MPEFGEQLRKAREAKGITQQKLAEELYVTRQTVSRWECGDRFPDLVTTKKLSQILEISVSQLLDGEETKDISEKKYFAEKQTVNNNIIIALLSVVVISYLVLLITQLIFIIPSFISASAITIADVWIVTVNLLYKVTGIIIFSVGLFWAMKGALSSQKAGLIAVGFWAALFILDLSKLYRATADTFGFILLISAPSMAGALASYHFYFKTNNTAYCSILIYIVSIWGIVRELYTMGSSVAFDAQYISAGNALSFFLYTCIYFLFIYQVYSLKRNGCMADKALTQR